MNGFLIDTNVLSEYNRRDGPDPSVDRWLRSTEQATQFVSVITLGEIQRGIELLADGKRRRALDMWLHQDLERWFEGRVLPVDRAVAARWAMLAAEGLRRGRRFLLSIPSSQLRLWLIT